MSGVFHGIEQRLKGGFSILEEVASIPGGKRLPAQLAEDLEFVRNMFVVAFADRCRLLFEMVEQFRQRGVAGASGPDIAAEPVASEQQEHGNGDIGQADQCQNPGDGSLCHAVGHQYPIDAGSRGQVDQGQCEGQPGHVSDTHSGASPLSMFRWRARYWAGAIPVQRLNARLKALSSEKPSRKAISPNA